MMLFTKKSLALWLPCTVVVAVLLAHGGCLDSVFYLDDWNQVHSNVGVEGGKWWLEQTRILTVLSYMWTWRAAGFSTFWFHLFNLLLHVAGALAVYYFGRHLLQVRSSAESEEGDKVRWIAWVAAMIFATHPMATEVTNYVRARDHGMVGLFSFLAACFAVMGAKRDVRWWWLCGVAVVLATISKGPGLAHAGLSVGIALFAAMSREQWRMLVGTKWRVMGGLLLLAVGVLFFHNTLVTLYLTLQEKTFRSSRLGLHTLTQCRVFWDYMKLLVWPDGLCSDHLVAWTWSMGDRAAWVAAAGLLMLSGGVGWLWVKRQQPVALLASLALGAICLRFLYVVSELMVEYRLYPALPYLSLLAALGLAACWRRLPQVTCVAGAALVVTYGVLSFKRSEDWSSMSRLCDSVLKNNRWQLRAFNGLSTQDVRDENWQGILGRYADFSKRLGEVIAENKRNPERFYENWPLWVVCEECMVTEALIHRNGVYEARKFHNALWKRMQENHFDTHYLLKELWEMGMGKIELAAENVEKARSHFDEARSGFFTTEIEKLLKPLNAGKPAPAK
jgi:protein O-mannosyl-transferase